MRDAHDQIKQHTWPMGVGVQNEFNWLSLLKKALKRSLTHISSKGCGWTYSSSVLCTAENEQKMMCRKYWCHSATAHQSLFCRHISTLGTWVQVIGLQPTCQPHMFGSEQAKLDHISWALFLNVGDVAGVHQEGLRWAGHGAEIFCKNQAFIISGENKV